MGPFSFWRMTCWTKFGDLKQLVHSLEHLGQLTGLCAGQMIQDSRCGRLRNGREHRLLFFFAVHLRHQSNDWNWAWSLLPLLQQVHVVGLFCPLLVRVMDLVSHRAHLPEHSVGTLPLSQQLTVGRRQE